MKYNQVSVIFSAREIGIEVARLLKKYGFSKECTSIEDYVESDAWENVVAIRVNFSAKTYYCWYDCEGRDSEIEYLRSMTGFVSTNGLARILREKRKCGEL